MAIRKIQTKTTWNDAAEVLNDNFALLEQQVSGSGNNTAYILSDWDKYSNDMATTHAVGAGLGYAMASNHPIKKVGKHWWIYSAMLNTYVDSGVTTGAGNGDIAYISAPDSGVAIITHDLNTYPSVTVIDHTNLVKQEVDCNIEYIDSNTIEVHWNGVLNGFVYII